jgi:hypothetical protein
LEAKKEKNATKEAFHAAPCAQFLFGPGGRQAGTVLLASGIPRKNGHGSQNGRKPGNQTQAPISGIQADYTGMDLIKVESPCQQRLCKRSIR